MFQNSFRFDESVRNLISHKNRYRETSARICKEVQTAFGRRTVDENLSYNGDICSDFINDGLFLKYYDYICYGDVEITVKGSFLTFSGRILSFCFTECAARKNKMIETILWKWLWTSAINLFISITSLFLQTQIFVKCWSFSKCQTSLLYRPVMTSSSRSEFSVKFRGIFWEISVHSPSLFLLSSFRCRWPRGQDIMTFFHDII